MAEEIKKILEDYLLIRLRNEIIVADESYFLLKTINEYWNAISKDGYDLFFKSTYSAHFIRYTLAIAKLFDKPSKKYDTISIPFVLKFIENNLDDIPIIQQSNLIHQFSLLGYEYEFIRSLSDYDLNRKILEHFKQHLPSTDYNGDLLLSRTLEILKTYRDKHYTHNENIDSSMLPKTTFDETSNLLLYAKQFVSIYALAYLKMYNTTEGREYFFTNDAKMTNTSFKRILEKAGLISLKK